jgi:predicted MFS family arabinose efflux permease
VVTVSHVLWISFAAAPDEAARTFHTTSVAIGLLVSVGPICSAALSIPAGAIPDRYGYRAPLLWAGAATAGFALLRPLADSFGMLLVLTVAVLLPQPFLINAVADLVNRHFPEEEESTAAGLGTMAIFLGITVGVALTPALVHALGVRATQLVYGLAAAAVLARFARIAPRRVPDRLRAPDELPVRAAVARVIRSRSLWRLSAVLFCGFGFYLGMTTWLDQILKPHGISESASGGVAAAITVGGMVGSVTLGVLSDRWQRRKPFLVAAAVVSLPALWLLGHLGSISGLVVVAAVMGYFLLAALPVSIAMVSEDPSLGPQVASTGVGVMLMAGNLGGALTVIVMGALKTSSGSFSHAIVLACALALVALVVAAGVREPQRVAEPV